ncbi:UNVERIFIED_CONTAM: hypothetical protein ABIC26_004348 [Paenibacillus sp. PvR008]
MEKEGASRFMSDDEFMKLVELPKPNPMQKP